MEKLLLELSENNVTIRVENGDLKVKFPKGIQANNLLERIGENKSELVKFISNWNGLNNNFARIPIAASKDQYVLSSVQGRLYYLYEFDKLSLAYNVPKVVQLEGVLDIHRLENAFKKLVSRHEILRTSFDNVDGKVFQRISERADFQMSVYESGETGIQTIVEKFIRPFALEQPSQLRVGLIKVSRQLHFLMVDLHHIITDGVSQGLLIKDFMALYNQEELPGVRLHYKDYAEWQQSAEQQQRLGNQREFWKREFSEANSLNLPTDYQRPAVKSFAGGSLSFMVSRELTEKLGAVAERASATMFMTVISIFNVLLSKLTNEEDITIGTPVAGRDHVDLQNVMGMFVNILPLRNYPKGDMTFAAFLSDVQTRTLSCFDNQSYQHEDLIVELNIPRGADRNPLFDVMLVFQNFDQGELAIPGLKLSPYDCGHKISKFDLELIVVESESGLQMTLVYSTDLFKDQTIERFAAYFRRIVSEVTGNPNKKLSDIEVISETEQHELLYGFNNSLVEYPKNQTVLDLIKAQVSASPDKIAVSFLSKPTSYLELDERSTFVVMQLMALGVQKNDVVGIFLEPSEYLVISILGILKAGAAFLAMDTSYPTARNIYMIENSGLKALITSADLESNREELCRIIPKRNVIVIDRLDFGSETCVSIPEVSPNDLAYLLYTSGSTGLPKGVMITHGSLFNYMSWSVQTYTKGKECPMALFSSISFDLTITSLLLPLVSGSTLFVYRPDEPLALLERVVSDGDAKVVKLTPSHLRLLCERKVDMSSISILIVGGESFSKDLATMALERCGGGVEIYNEYGPTEATVGCVLHRLNLQDAESGDTVLIGKPAANNQIYILDKYLRLVPPGVVGELFIGGRQLSKGYISSKEQTTARFLMNPYNNEPMYRTGDLGRWLPDGNLEYQGRMDDQVKIRGYRIELGEIESRLGQHEEIASAVVLSQARGGDASLVAYYVSEDELSATGLRNYLSEYLPDYMLPSYYVHLKEIPLTTNGKIDRKQLPEAEPGTGQDYIGPRTKEEKLLSDVWSKVLSIEKISIRDNFFSIGGDSIKSIQVCSRMRMSGYELSVKNMLSYPTIEALGVRLEVIKRQCDQSEVIGMIPLTGIQRKFFESTTSNKHHYNQSVMLNFSTRITGEEVRKIFVALQGHHDALRMSYQVEGSSIQQYNHGIDYPLSLRVADLRGEENWKEKLLGLCNSIQESIELDLGPLVKVGLFDVDDGSRLLVVVHHLVIDGISWRILFEDIETLYTQIKEGQSLKLPMKTDSFKVWSDQIRAYMKSPGYTSGVEYWNSVLQRPQVTIRRSGSGERKEVVTSGFTLSKGLTERLLSEVHGTFNTQINDVLLAGLLRSVNTCYGEGYLRIDLEGHGREEVIGGLDVSRTVGWFTSVYPVMLESRGEGLSELIKSVKESLRGIPNRGIDYLIGTQLGGEIGNSERSQLIFNYLGQFDSDTQGRVFTIATESTGSDTSVQQHREYDWEVLGLISGGQLRISISYDAQQYDKGSMNRLMAGYETSLQELIDYCANYGRQELTPSDLTYKGLSISQLDKLQEKLIGYEN